MRNVHTIGRPDSITPPLAVIMMECGRYKDDARHVVKPSR